MAITADEVYKRNGEEHSEEPIMVTITLAEYRSLIEENARFQCDISRLNDIIYQLEREKDNG